MTLVRLQQSIILIAVPRFYLDRTSLSWAQQLNLLSNAAPVREPNLCSLTLSCLQRLQTYNQSNATSFIHWLQQTIYLS